MNRPVAPVKPLKNAKPPSLNKIYQKAIFKHPENHSFILVDIANMKEVDDFYFDENNGYESLDKMRLSDMIAIKELLVDVEDFCIRIVYVDFLDEDEFIVEYEVPKPAEEHEAELEAFQNRFRDYETALEDYQLKSELYIEHRKKQKISKLKKELKDLDEGIVDE